MWAIANRLNMITGLLAGERKCSFQRRHTRCSATSSAHRRRRPAAFEACTLPGMRCACCGPRFGSVGARGFVNSSGTVSNTQFAASRGLPAIAVSAGSDTVDNAGLANPYSVIVAQLTVKLLKTLQARAALEGLLAPGVALNVNIPNAPSASTKFAFSRFGSFDAYNLKFRSESPYGIDFSVNAAESATRAQAEDESVVYKTRVAVTPCKWASSTALWRNSGCARIFTVSSLSD